MPSFIATRTYITPFSLANSCRLFFDIRVISQAPRPKYKTEKIKICKVSTILPALA